MGRPYDFEAGTDSHISIPNLIRSIPMIHVCSLARLYETVAATGARHVVSLLKDTDLVQRPEKIRAEDHLILGMDDITAPLEGYVEPAHEHVARLLAFVRGWERAAPLVIH